MSRMSARVWRRVGPWLTPVLVAVEIALVWTGVLSVLGAVVLIVVVEALLALTVFGRGIAAARRLRAARSAGSGGWSAAENALAEMLPRPAARLLLIEARMWACLVRWIARRRPGAPSYGYGRNLRPLLWGVLGLLVVEGAVVEVVLAALLGHASPWVWVAFGLHVYALIWIGGFLGSLRVLPHEVDGMRLHLRDSVFRTVTVPLAAIASVTMRQRGNTGRSGWNIDADGIGLLAYGDASVRIGLTPEHGVLVGTQLAPERLQAIDLTVDEADGFIAALHARSGEVASAED